MPYAEDIFAPASHPEVVPDEMRPMTTETKRQIIRLVIAKAMQGDIVPLEDCDEGGEEMAAVAYTQWLDMPGDDTAFINVSYNPPEARCMDGLSYVGRVGFMDNLDHHRTNRVVHVTEYTINETPDGGLDFERHAPIEGDRPHGGDITALFAQWDDERQGEQEEREHGTSFVSEAEGRRVATELFNATELIL